MMICASMRTKTSKDGTEYVLVVKCPWCGACTTEYNDKAMKNMEHCPECDTEYQQGSHWFWVSKARLGMVNKNADKNLKI